LSVNFRQGGLEPSSENSEIEFEQKMVFGDGSRLLIAQGRHKTPRVLVVGRSNPLLAGDFVVNACRMLTLHGISFAVLESPSIHLHNELGKWVDPNRLWSPVRNGLIAVMALRYPGFWRHITFSGNQIAISIKGKIARLRHAIHALGRERETVVIGHSMGGRLATMIADEIGLKGVVCFAYPFRPPGAGPEPERYAHLEHLATRTLLFQGDDDVYGSLASLGNFRLSERIDARRLDADHDMNLSPDTWDLVFETIAREFWPEHDR